MPPVLKRPVAEICAFGKPSACAVTVAWPFWAEVKSTVEK
jgi:hypothetical protein